jgi:hypothetical protein
MTKISYDGLEYDTETRQVTFTDKVCWDCKGTTKVTRYDLCPNNHQVTHGKPCKYCGAKNRHSHQVVGSHVETCSMCKGTGLIRTDLYTMVDLRGLFENVEVKFGTAHRSGNLNEGYLGLGILAGCTDYGRYLTTENPQEAALAGVKEQLDYSQVGNLVSEDGHLVKEVIVTLVRDGYHAYAYGAKFASK